MDRLRKFKNRLKEKKFLIVLVLFILMLIGNIMYQGQLGGFYYNTIQQMYFYAFNAGYVLEQDIFDETQYVRCISSMTAISASSSKIYFDIANLIEYQYTDLNNLDQIREDEAFRKEAVMQLKAYSQALTTVLQEMDQYKERHPSSLLSYFEPVIPYAAGKAYFDYLSRRPDRSEIYYRSKFHERITVEFHKALDQSQ